MLYNACVDASLWYTLISKHVVLKRLKKIFSLFVCFYGAYWGLTTLALLDNLGSVSVDDVVSWLMTCQHESSTYHSIIFLDHTVSH